MSIYTKMYFYKQEIYHNGISEQESDKKPIIIIQKNKGYKDMIISNIKPIWSQTPKTQLRDKNVFLCGNFNCYRIMRLVSI